MNFPTIDRSFFAGECFDAYRVLGAHPFRDDFGQEGWRFAVWAPGAVAVEICGGFDGWGPGVPMQKADTGVWSGFVPGLAEGELYKYRIHGKDGSTVMRADPYAFSTELRPGTASRLARMDFAFDDSSWMERRDKCRNLPLNIYELHAGSWKHKPNATREDGSDGWYNYRELARELIPWLLDHRFTHVELLPLAEHPFDGSWGYQTTGYFSVTSRYGDPADFAAFLRLMEEAGFAVKHGRGGVLSFLAPGQDKYTRLRASTLGDGFDPEGIRAVIAGEQPIPELPEDSPAPPRRVNLMIDIQQRMAQGKSPAYERWAKVYNLKQMAAALQYLQEHNLMDYDELSASTEAALSHTVRLMGATVDYAKTRPVFNGYKAAMNEILVGAKLPKMNALKKERRELSEKRKALYAEYRKAQADMRQAVAVKANIDHLLGVTDGRENKAQER